MRNYFLYILLIVQLYAAGDIAAQNTGINFHKLGFNEGLHDGIIRCMAQDKLGYIWIGGVGAVNRYNGKRVTRYAYQPGDSTSPYNSQPRSMCSDAEGKFWIGFETGVVQFDFKNGSFKRIPALKNQYIKGMTGVGDSLLFFATRQGLLSYNKKTEQVFNYTLSTSSLHLPLYKKVVSSVLHLNKMLYIGTNAGLVLFNPVTNKAEEVNAQLLSRLNISFMSADKQNNIWMCTNGDVNLCRVSSDFKQLDIFDKIFKSSDVNRDFNFIGLVNDRNDNTWAITAGNGLFQIDAQSKTYKRFTYNPFYLTGPSTNSWQSIFLDQSGTVWLGCNVDGVNYFEPGKKLFNTILPFPDLKGLRSSTIGRGVAFDNGGNIWMGNEDGLSRYNPQTNSYNTWRNEEGKKQVLYSNMIRTLLYADDAIWIGTGAGVNKFNLLSGKMEFIDSKNLPRRYYNSITKDKSGNIWFCTNDTASVYWYNINEKKYHSISEDTLLAKYTRFTPTSYVFEDSKNRLWISVARKGLLMADKKKGVTKLFQATDTGTHTLIGNQVIDIKEDLDGKIWAATFSGLSCIDVEGNSIVSYNDKNGLPGSMVSSLGIDKNNQVWVGVNGGLTMFSADRKKITVFLASDGLPSVGFPEHAGVETGNGEIVMPTFNGYFHFNPAQYTVQKSQFPFYVSGYSIFDKDYYRVSEGDSNASIRLKATQNSFTIHLTALNYSDPSQTWVAYRLEGFEKEWHYTQDAKAVYTNVPGGNYTFVYKASANNSHWSEISPKVLSIKLGTHFYKTIWFYLLMGFLAISGLFFIYRFRLRQQEKLLLLENKAQALEKEKTQVMYEGLKQQLNPHFLFNSLTSLSGLIESDQQLAGTFLKQMSKIYRYILKSGDSELVSLREEVEMVQVYVNLQKTRFKKGLLVNVNIQENDLSRKIPPVTLQNMVENAIKHNIIDIDSPLVIEIYTDNDYLVVKNNLQKKNVVETSNRQGLASLQSLYQYLSERPVSIEENEKEFIIRLPLI